MAIFRKQTKVVKSLYKHLKRVPKKVKSGVIKSRTYSALKLRADSLIEIFKGPKLESTHKILSERDRKGTYWYRDFGKSEWVRKTSDAPEPVSEKQRSVTFDDDVIELFVPKGGAILEFETADEFVVPKIHHFMNVSATPVFFAPEKKKPVVTLATEQRKSNAQIAASFFGVNLNPVNTDRKKSGPPNKPLPTLPTNK